MARTVACVYTLLRVCALLHTVANNPPLIIQLLTEQYVFFDGRIEDPGGLGRVADLTAADV